MTRHYTEKEKTAITKRLMKEKPSNLKITFRHISFKFDNHKISYDIRVKRHEKFVGGWSRKYRRIYVDDDFPKKINFDAVALHEAIERYVTLRYHLKEEGRAHKIATAQEHAFINRRGGNWRSHQRYIYLIWKKEGKH